MAAKDVRFSADARERMMRGVDILANAVKITLAPKGCNVILDKSFGAPRSIKDGVTVASSRPTTPQATAPRSRPCLPRPSCARGIEVRRRRHEGAAIGR